MLLTTVNPLYICARVIFENFRKSGTKTKIQTLSICFPVLAQLCNGTFHKHLQELYMPLVVRYIDLMESSIAQSVHRGFEQETWQSVK